MQARESWARPSDIRQGIAGLPQTAPVFAHQIVRKFNQVLGMPLGSGCYNKLLHQMPLPIKGGDYPILRRNSKQKYLSVKSLLVHIKRRISYLFTTSL